MKNRIISAAILLSTSIFLIVSCNNFTQESQVEEKEIYSTSQPLHSWRESASKQSIIDFVTSTTKKESPVFIPEKDRIAVFDNDGTLWSEQPMYFQLAFTIDRVKALAPSHPEWKTTQPFQALLEGDMKTAMAGGTQAAFELIMATHAGMTTTEFDQIVKDWITTAKHPVTGKLYTEMVYQPMLELLAYLRANGYKTFIVSGGGVDFMRPWVEQVYGIPPDQVVGSSGKVKFDIIDGKPVLTKLAEINFIDDKEGKPVGIHQYIGKRPVFAAGNSDGDYEMLQWVSSSTNQPSFGMIIHHTDSIREWAYDRQSHTGRLEKGLDDADKYNWKLVDMLKDWKSIYPSDKTNDIE